MAYSVVLAGVARIRAFLLASNSFSTELLRAFLVEAPECTEISEVLHGVPTVELDEYLGAVFRRATTGGKHHFVPHLPNVPLFGVYNATLTADRSFAVNTTINRYLLERRGEGEPLMEGFDREVQLIFRGASERPPLIVAFTGANSHETDYFESKVFAVECAMIRDTRAALEISGKPFLIFYTPHPLHSWPAVTTNPRLAEAGVVLHPDTGFTWLVADVCLALYSSALWDAAFAGMMVYSPLCVRDGFFPVATLDCLAHPGAGESSREALTRFLREQVDQPSESLHQRMRHRAARFWSGEMRGLTDGDPA